MKPLQADGGVGISPGADALRAAAEDPSLRIGVAEFKAGVANEVASLFAAGGDRFDRQAVDPHRSRSAQQADGQDRIALLGTGTRLETWVHLSPIESVQGPKPPQPALIKSSLRNTMSIDGSSPRARPAAGP